MQHCQQSLIAMNSLQLPFSTKCQQQLYRIVSKQNRLHHHLHQYHKKRESYNFFSISNDYVFTVHYIFFDRRRTCLDFSEVYQRPYRASMMEHFFSKLHLRPFFSQSFVKPCKIHRKVSTRKSYFQSPILQAWTCNFPKKMTSMQLVSYKFSEIWQNSYSARHLWPYVI